VPSAGVVLVASTCSSPPALASSCWGSGDGESGSVVSSGAGAKTCSGLKPHGRHSPNEVESVMSLNKSKRIEYAL
jgi:hypothetical protein